MTYKYKYTDRDLIKALIDFKEEHDRWPKMADMKGPYWPSRSTYQVRFASEEGKMDGFGIALARAQARYNMQVTLNEYDMYQKNIFARIFWRIRSWFDGVL